MSTVQQLSKEEQYMFLLAITIQNLNTDRVKMYPVEWIMNEIDRMGIAWCKSYNNIDVILDNNTLKVTIFI